MPPKTKYEKKTIIDAAFELAKINGLSGITARSVATKLKSSVAPIYVNFATIDDLIHAVVERVFSISRKMLEEQKSQSMFENIGRASLNFAREYPILFRELSIAPNPYMTSYEVIEKTMLEALGEDEVLKNWPISKRRRLLLKMRVFQMGLSAMVANGHVPSWLSDEELEELLIEVGKDMMIAHQVNHKNT